MKDEQAYLAKLEREAEVLGRKAAAAKAKLEAFRVYMKTVHGSVDKKVPLKDAIEQVMRTKGGSFTAPMMVEALGDALPHSNDPLNTVRACMAQHFQRVEGKRGHYSLKG